MTNEELFKKELKRAESFLKSTNKNEHCYWKLYASKYPNGKPNPNNLKATNFESDDLTDSLRILQNEMMLHGQLSPKFWLLVAVASKNDPNGITMHLHNALCDESTFNPTIAGFPQSNTSNQMQQQLLDMQRQMWEKTSELQQQLLEEKHDRELERLSDRIAGLEDSRKTIVDAIAGFADSGTGRLIVAGIMGIIQQKMATPSAPIHPQTPMGENNADATPSPDDATPSDVRESLQSLKNQFGESYADVLKGIAEFCTNNPQYAQQLMNQQKQKNNG